jgi:Flp pilus assembly pilin Flp
MQQLLSAFWNQENGQDMVEYSLLLGFVALSGAAVLTGLRNEMVHVWNTISTSFSTAAS